MMEATEILPGLPAVKGKPVHVAFDGGRLTSDAGILLLSAVEQPSSNGSRLPNGWPPASRTRATLTGCGMSLRR